LPPDRSMSDASAIMLAVEQLERNLPDNFPALSRSQAFISLLMGVGDRDARQAVRAQLTRRHLGVSAAVRAEPS
jgi:hypothetical protein